ncbi:MAG: hypothetical protein L0229_23135 [Blastocatellia bacterium]|nr:hypothetical protein [Blastocatellia bacterium]
MEGICSKKIKVIRPDNKVVRGLMETSLTTSGPRTPVVLIAPPYAKTIRDMFFVSLYLVLNGFRTVRYDSANHIGVSDGDVFDFTLSSAQQDLIAFIDALRHQYPDAPPAVFSSSLSARVAFRALASSDEVCVQASLVGVVHVQDTLHRVLGHDFVDDLLKGRAIPDIRDVLGYEVGRGFIEDVVDAGWYSRESTQQDLVSCRFPIIHICTERDDWAQLQDIEVAFSGNGSLAPRELYMIPGSSHHLEKNPSAARLALVQAIASLKRYTAGEQVEPSEVRCPNFVDLVRKNRHERYLESIGYCIN